jgi:outer membrane protein assembly factor BamB
MKQVLLVIIGLNWSLVSAREPLTAIVPAQRWVSTSSLGDRADMNSVEMVVVDDTVVVAADANGTGATTLTAFDVLKGKVRWSETTPSGRGLGTLVGSAGRVVFQDLDGTLVVFAVASGKKQLTSKIDCAFMPHGGTPFVSVGGHLLVGTCSHLIRDADRPAEVADTRLLAVDLGTGRVKWRDSIDEDRPMAVVQSDALIFLVRRFRPSNGLQVQARSRETGSVLWEQQIPFVEEPHVGVFGRNVIVVGEHTVMISSKGKPVWSTTDSSLRWLAVTSELPILDSTLVSISPGADELRGLDLYRGRVIKRWFLGRTAASDQTQWVQVRGDRIIAWLDERNSPFEPAAIAVVTNKRARLFQSPLAKDDELIASDVTKTSWLILSAERDSGKRPMKLRSLSIE